MCCKMQHYSTSFKITCKLTLDIVYRQSAHFSGKLPNEYEKMIFPIVESERKIEEIHVNVSSINSINTAYDND